MSIQIIYYNLLIKIKQLNSSINYSLHSFDKNS